MKTSGSSTLIYILHFILQIKVSNKSSQQGDWNLKPQIALYIVRKSYKKKVEY